MRTNTEIVMVEESGRTQLRCPVSGCDLPDMTHVVGVRWEKDPEEGDRKRARMEVRCENGHGFVLVIKNHGGDSFFEWEVLLDNQSPLVLHKKW